MGITQHKMSQKPQTIPNEIQNEEDDEIIDNYSYDDHFTIIKEEEDKEKDIDIKTTETTPHQYQKTFDTDIEQIISINKLHTKNDKEVLFISDLEMQEDDNPSYYYPLFCVLTRIQFMTYLTKADFLSMKKPIARLSLESVDSVDVIKYDSQYHFQINIKQDDQHLIFKGKNEDLIFKWVVVLNYFTSTSTVKKNKDTEYSCSMCLDDQ